MIGGSGVGVYLKECLPYFIQSTDNFLLLGNTAQLNSFSTNSNVKIIECNIKPFSVKELFFFPKEISNKINIANLFYSPFFNIPCRIKIPIFTTIHDIVFPDMPELTSKTGLTVRMMFYRRAYKKSQKIFTVSGFSKSRIEHYLGKTKPVIVTHSAIQSVFLSYRSSVQNVQKTQTIVFIGNIKKHKGLELLLDAFVIARKEGLTYKLVIIGSKDNFRSSENSIFKKVEAIDSDAVTFTGFISDKKLIEYLSEAALLVQPSLYEGFCLPPLEAMVLGSHALISDIAVLREIYSGYPVTFFKAGCTKDLKEKMLELLMKKNLSFPILPDELLLKYTFEKTTSIIMKELQ
jgi:glycosyltransferase involved in cell wall biosynthesis